MAYEYSVRLHWNLTYNSFGGIMHCIEEVAAIKLDYSIIKMLAFGADYTETVNGSIMFSRFSQKERNALSYGTDKSYTTAGVRLEFETDSVQLRIEVCAKDTIPYGRNFYAFDVYCNGEMIGQIKNFNKEPVYPYKKYSTGERHKRFRLGNGMKHISIYFPWSVQGMIDEIEIDDGSAVRPVSKKKRIIMYGDSITQGYDAASPSYSYASRLADFFDADALNKGIGGSGFMPELARVKTEFLPDFITVAYGTNDWKISGFEDFYSRSKAFFENLSNNYPDIDIFAIAPIWRADFAEKHALGDFFRVLETLNEISLKHKNIHFINGADFIPEDTEYFRDGYLHPNDKGFAFYAKALNNKILKIMKG